MRLSKLLKALKIKQVYPAVGPDPEINSIHYRAQEVKPGGLFIAVCGLKTDGHAFIGTAVKNGAIAIVSSQKSSAEIWEVVVPDTRQAQADLSAYFYGQPCDDLVLIGITGTNGKTTTAYLIESILKQAGFAVGVIGTINYRYQDQIFNNPVTTPESVDLQYILAQMRTAGVTHVVMEVSSHALDLERLRACMFDVCVFTNLTRDHLDYHKDMDVYWECKQKLFKEYLKTGKTTAVINCDNKFGRQLVTKTQTTATITVGADLCVRPELSLKGIQTVIALPQGCIEINSPLTGAHNLENILTAVGAGSALGISDTNIKQGIENLLLIPGRLELIPNECDLYIYVDYAHTPDALEKVLHSLRSLAPAHLICVFGCGGDRDQGKRSLMGTVAAKFSDQIIVTSDNPRSEDPRGIINDILKGVNSDYIVEPDRKTAIEMAIALAQPGDVVLIAGKGHETYQIIGEQILAFDDRIVAAQVLGQTWKMTDILTALNLSGPLFSDLEFKSISTDSRRISPDDLFIAIRSGHQYIKDVIQKGVRGVLMEENAVSNLPINTQTAVITVADTVAALGDLAAFWRRQHDVKVVAITGSNGKTTTREMISQIFAQQYNILTTPKNFNNEIGLSLTLLNLRRKHQWVILELGMNHLGEISRLSKICAPDLAVITNIGPAHLEGVGSLEGVLKAKSEIIQGMPPGSTICLNHDDPMLVRLSQEWKTAQLPFNQIFYCQDDVIDIELQTPADFMVSNASAAAAVAGCAGISRQKIKTGLAGFKPVPGRMNIFECGGVRIIDATYNANPASVTAAIQTLNTVKGHDRAALVIGDMFELGQEAPQLHARIGAVAGPIVDQLFITGKYCTSVAQGAINAGLPSEQIFKGSLIQIYQALKHWCQSGDWVLVQGSRAMGMEAIINLWKNKTG